MLSFLLFLINFYFYVFYKLVFLPLLIEITLFFSTNEINLLYLELSSESLVNAV